MKNALLTFALLCSLFTESKGVVWSEPEKIIQSGGKHVSTVDNSGRLWVYIANYAITYFDESWVEPMSVELGPGMWFYPGIYIDREERVWVFCNDDWNIRYRTYDGVVWSVVDSVPVYPSYNGLACYTADSSGGVWVGWTTDWWYWLDVAYNRYVDGSWDLPEVLTDTNELADHAIHSMTTDALGRVWVAWRNHGSMIDLQSFEAAYFTNDKGWSEEIELSTIVGHELTLSPDREGGIWALWNRPDTTGSDDYYVLVSHCEEEVWSGADTIANAGNLTQSSHPYGKVTVDKNGNVWAVWRQAVKTPYDQNGDIYYSVNTGDGWSEPEPVNEDTAADTSPDIAVDGDGRVWCVWKSNREGEDEWDYSIWASYTTIDGVEEEETEPIKPGIISISPNPMRSKATISYSVAGQVESRENTYVELSVFDVSGREIRILASDNHAPGHYTVAWDGKDKYGASLSSGVYFIRMNAADFEAKDRVVLIK